MMEKIKIRYNDSKKFIKSLNKEKITNFIKGNSNLVIAVIVCTFLISGYVIGNLRTTKGNLLKDLQTSLEKGSTRKLEELLRVNGKRVTKEQIVPLVNYYKDQNQRVIELMRDLKDDGKSNIMRIANQKGLFGENYYVELDTYDLKVESNFKDAKIYLNDNEEIIEGQEIKGLTPGEYKLSAKLDGEYGEITTTNDLVLMKNENVELNLDAINITVDSKFKGAKVYINGEDSGKKVKDFKDIGPMPKDESITIHLEEELPWGKVKSDEVKVLDNPIIKLDINLENEKLWNETEETVEGFYKSVFDALNNEDKNLILNSTETVKNKIYGILEKDYFIFKNKYSIESINIEKEKSDFSYDDGIYKGTIVCDVNYDVSKMLFGLGKENFKKKFFTKVIYNEGKWEVENVDNFSL